MVKYELWWWDLGEMETWCYSFEIQVEGYVLVLEKHMSSIALAFWEAHIEKPWGVMLAMH